jgi:hypothetical protein
MAGQADRCASKLHLQAGLGRYRVRLVAGQRHWFATANQNVAEPGGSPVPQPQCGDSIGWRKSIAAGFVWRWPRCRPVAQIFSTERLPRADLRHWTLLLWN